jgi:hypothetical protein
LLSASIADDTEYITESTPASRSSAAVPSLTATQSIDENDDDNAEQDREVAQRRTVGSATPTARTSSTSSSAAPQTPNASHRSLMIRSGGFGTLLSIADASSTTLVRNGARVSD